MPLYDRESNLIAPGAFLNPFLTFSSIIIYTEIQVIVFSCLKFHVFCFLQSAAHLLRTYLYVRDRYHVRCWGK